MSVASLFSHAQVAPFRAILEDSPTAVRLLENLDRVATKFELVASGAGPRGTKLPAGSIWGGRYQVLANKVLLSEDLLGAGTVALAGSPDAATKITASAIAHEGVHRLQRGRLLRGMIASPLMDAVAGVRGMFDRSLPGSASRRYVEGAERNALRFEMEAYATQARIEAELGLATSEASFVRDGVVDMEGLYQYIRGDYAPLRRSALVSPVLGVMGLAAPAAGIAMLAME